MTTEGLKRPQGGHALHPYEEERLRQCMANSARLRQLGIHVFSSIFPNNSGNALNKKKSQSIGVMKTPNLSTILHKMILMKGM